MEGKEKINIQHPEAWELLVSIGDKRVDYILYTPSVTGSLVVGGVDCVDDSLQALEDAIYDTPELLGEYKRVRVLVQSQRFVILPGDTADDDSIRLLSEAFPGDNGDTALCALSQCGVKIAYLMPQGMSAFIGRTFSYPEVSHRLLPLCEHCAQQQSGIEVSRMCLNFQQDRMDVIVCRGNALQLANIFMFNNARDAVYFAMAAWRACGLNQLNDELLLMGERETCAELTPVLREYVKSVMPAEFPAEAMRLGRNAMQVPLELILLALCA